jgi:hypothetical protein
MMRWVAVAALACATAAPLAAQRGELAVFSGVVLSPELEFDRVWSITTGAPVYTRERGTRSSGLLVGGTMSAALRGHVFGEVGLLVHSTERRISRTATGDHTGPFASRTDLRGVITSIWMGPSYRFVDRELVAVSLTVGPMVQLLAGPAFSGEGPDRNSASTPVSFGLLAGVRARYWVSDRLGVHVAVDDAMWRFPLLPHESESSFFPETRRRTPRQHDLRIQLGAALPLF